MCDEEEDDTALCAETSKEQNDSIKELFNIRVQVNTLEKRLAAKECLLAVAHRKCALLDAAEQEAHGAKAELAKATDALVQLKASATKSRERHAAGEDEMTKLRELLRASRADQVRSSERAVSLQRQIHTLEAELAASRQRAVRERERRMKAESHLGDVLPELEQANELMVRMEQERSKLQSMVQELEELKESDET